MDFREDAEQSRFRLELREWLKHNIPEGWQDASTIEEQRALRKSWHRSLYNAGYIGLSWPTEYGGRGLSPLYDAILNDEVGRVDAPYLPAVINFLGRAIFTYGTEEQKRTHLARMLSGEVQWCQGFSEPGAGSDLASLRTRAELNGERYVINGQKMWTSGALTAEWCLVLVRTDTQVPKHKGISCLITPMDVPGIETRAIYLANGEPETCEVFFTDVEVPVENRIGAEGQGWNIAMTTVSYERGASDTGSIARLRQQLRQLEQIAVQRGLDRQSDMRRRLARAYVDVEVLAQNAAYQLSRRISGHQAGPEGSIGKLLWSRASQELMHTALELTGADVLTGLMPEWLSDYFQSRPVSVYGGSSQIQKNILARMLELPR
ncbi:acyl-CoA dehydrogenase family protein [Paraburkholderia sp. HP33-1]|uniref:acyl-CoA dehydrogenase family protein n=1 Tax=Paraburkholderia sp. HP33-1 TaxID=2883243 RepID=UPI001F2743A1|nr:acyl-CoA dehydrogenase family protein [Paraburkholderia sp. HP33-1]